MPIFTTARLTDSNGAAARTAVDQARCQVGPNAIIQTAAALSALIGADAPRTVFRRAGLGRYLECMPNDMVSQDEAACLFAAVRSSLPQADAVRVFQYAGMLTGRYLLAHRIPVPAKRLLRALPHALSARLLISAIGRSAWTFAGSGVFQCTRGRRLSIKIAGNPLAVPGCPWHLGVFQTLFGDLVSAAVTVRHSACCATGDGACISEFQLNAGRCIDATPGIDADRETRAGS
jgi:divinyl protochlorophyllide a 8-vinyl-reductase